MKVLNVIIYNDADIVVTPLGDRYYKLAADTKINIYTDQGIFVYSFKKGFVTNFRSGGLFVDPFVDQIGTVLMQAAYLCHDAAYTPCLACGMEHPISRKLADQLLKAMLIYAELCIFKANVVYTSVRLCGKHAYEEDDSLTEENSKLFKFEWVA